MTALALLASGGAWTTLPARLLHPRAAVEADGPTDTAPIDSPCGASFIC